MGNEQSAQAPPAAADTSVVAPLSSSIPPPNHPPFGKFGGGGSSSPSSSSSSENGVSACPVIKGGAAPNMLAMMAANKPTGASGMLSGGAPGACPVMHDAGKNGGITLPSSSTSSSSSSTTAPSSSSSSKSRGPIYNVYSQVIDPTNNMPAPNQTPSPGQKVPLSTQRVQSTIPKGGTDTTWLYPSPQMFWNALVRKEKADGVQETDVDMVIAIHNEMNERTWRQLMTWEESHKSEHLPGEPALRRFMGNPFKNSPKAKAKALAGYGYPFDRHDWFVDRGGKQVHYIIDYFYNPKGDALAKQPESFDASAQFTRSIYVDVRPALEDASSVFDRLKHFPERFRASLNRPWFVAEGIDPSLVPEEAKGEGGSSSSSAAKPAQAQYSSEKHSEAIAGGAATSSNSPSTDASGVNWEAFDAKCLPLLNALKTAVDDETRRSASIALNYSMGRQLCPTEAASFMSVLESNERDGKAGEAGGREEAVFDIMTKCVAGKIALRPRSIIQNGGGGGSVAATTQMK